MIALDVSETTTVVVPKPAKGQPPVEWTLGLLPLAKYDEFTAASNTLMAPYRRHLLKHFHKPEGAEESKFDADESAACPECDTLRAAPEVAGRALNRQIVQWGLRAVNRPNLLVFEPAALAGQEYKVLSPACVEQLARLREGGIITALAAHIIRINTLSEDDILGFKSPSGA